MRKPSGIDNVAMTGRLIVYDYLFRSAASARRTHPRVPPRQEAEVIPLELTEAFRFHF